MSVHNGVATTTRPASTGPSPSPGRLGTRIGWTWVLLSSLAIVAYAVVPYLTAALSDLAETGGGTAGLADHYATQSPVVVGGFYAHIVGGGVALALMPLQFVRMLRERAPKVHRWIGRVALVGLAVGAVGALVIAPFNSAGLVGLFGFGGLGMVWLYAGWRAYRAIRRGDVANHRAWMMRTFAVTYSAVTLRLWLFALIFAQIPFAGPDGFDFEAAFDNAYGVVPFLAWIPNLLVAEWLIRRRGLPSYRIAPPNARESVRAPRQTLDAAVSMNRV
ncbi:DUF2306 domain-containing protein [Microbacterium sp.]|jgi:uncharacterized membrane protein|uniref:DUF2306 domain-containing protein n=1 Tax=Microbacterium sp. TaxID=51671 RepID=UPI002CBCAA1C|nr:DUF2306 domain-containing protein [Microbacterium sp.]HWL76535.1 DUF2306 domain-containing protein [Microbacterium sp.]